MSEIVDFTEGTWTARGHLSWEEMSYLVSAWMHDDTILIGEVMHGWWRFIPGDDGYYIDAIPGSRGAFKVTFAQELVEVADELPEKM
jgi:hypothetical protein